MYPQTAADDDEERAFGRAPVVRSRRYLAVGARSGE
jgi:hypothetical protein